LHEIRDDWSIKPGFFSLTTPSPSGIFEWHSTGQMIPSADSLNSFLYGPLSVFAGLRKPPVFKGNFNANTVLVIETGNQVNQALMQVFLDQAVVFEQPVEASRSYLIEVPAGYHQLRLDNIGAGFASVLEIEQLRLENYLPKIRAFGSLQDGSVLAWIHHRDHNWKYLYDNNQAPEPASAEVVLPLKTGAYRLDWYNTDSGTIDSVSMAEAASGGLVLNLPPMQADLALIANFIHDLREYAQYQGVMVFPNPSKRNFTFAFELEKPVPVSLEIIDLHGRLVFRTQKLNTKKGVNQITWKTDQPGFGVLEKAKAGLYIYRLVLPKRTITGKLMVSH
ncbi:MAG: T9SS type A sorting domain-containing protein, partial [Bacteroidales bacterium]|nr:T9SS type A sorting domain-containing protein [Bacteroidales bacterium]